MRIVLYELCKILNLRLIFILSIFTFLFYNMFLSVISFPNDSSSCKADVQLNITLMEKLDDTALYTDEWNVLEEIRQETTEKLNEIEQEYDVLVEAGFTTFDEASDYYDDVISEKDSSELTEEEVTFQDAIDDLDFYNEESSELVFLRQVIDNINDNSDYGFVEATEEEAEDLTTRSDGTSKYSSEEAKERIIEIYSRDYISLAPDSVIELTQTDMVKIMILTIISCLVLIIPYQIRERVRKVISLYLTTKQGRNLYKKQRLAVICAGVVISLCQIIVFGIICASRGIFYFWDCSAVTYINTLWFNMNLGTYFLCYAILILIFAVVCSTIFYLISRRSTNYIVGMIIGLIFGIICCIYGSLMLGNLFYVYETNNSWSDLLNKFMEWKFHWGYLTVFIWVIILCIIFFKLNIKDKKRDI